MVDAVLRSRRRKARERLAVAATRYAAQGWPVCVGAEFRTRVPQQRQPGKRESGQPGQRQPSQRQPGQRQSDQAGSGRACSCDRVGCPAPGAHPLSPAWKREASCDPAVVAQWWSERPAATILLVTGRTFDVLDVPAAAGASALRRFELADLAPGPVAVSAGDRVLFFVATRSTGDEDEWWSCRLDCEPDVVPDVAGLRWHCRDSYVVAPPSRLVNGTSARWVAEPGTDALPDALRLLEVLADACEETAP
jgi:Bifunctional DNA primase/polymerase, N-terminal